VTCHVVLQQCADFGEHQRSVEWQRVVRVTFAKEDADKMYTKYKRIRPNKSCLLLQNKHYQ